MRTLLTAFAKAMKGLTMVADAAGGKTKENIVDVIGVDTSCEEFSPFLADMNSSLTGNGSLISSNAVCVEDTFAQL